MKLPGLLLAYSPLLSSLLKASEGVEYRALFLKPDSKQINIQNASTSINEIRFVYLLGIVEQAHLACITSIARNLRWLEAANNAVSQNNALAFSASLRGYLESSADSHDVMRYLPASLEKLFPYIYLVFARAKEVNNIMVAPNELEERLIHYAYAKKPIKGTPPYPDHTNKTNAEYIRVFENSGVLNAKTLYSELCELTHPAAASVSCFLDEEKDCIKFNPNKDMEVIDKLLTQYEETIYNLTILSLNPALLSLCFLRRLCNRFPAPTDMEIEPIGNAKSKLLAIDKFVEDYNNGIFNLQVFLKELK